MLTTKSTRHSNTTSLGNSLDWDSPSTVTGTVKRRPVSGSSDCDYTEEKCDSGEDVEKEKKFRVENSVKRKPKSLRTSGIPRSEYYNNYDVRCKWRVARNEGVKCENCKSFQKQINWTTSEIFTDFQ